MSMSWIFCGVSGCVKRQASYDARVQCYLRRTWKLLPASTQMICEEYK